MGIKKLSWVFFPDTENGYYETRILPTENNFKVIIKKINEIIEKISPENEDDDEENK